MNKIKIFIISFCLTLSTLFIDITPTYAMEKAGYSSSILLKVGKGQYEDPDFILNSMDGLSLEIYSYSKDTTSIYTYSAMGLTGYNGWYRFSKNTGISFDIDHQGLENFCYDIYILNSDGERIYHLYYANARTSEIDFSLFSPYSPPSDDVGGNTTVNFDDTNIVNNLEDISKKLDSFISIFLFYFGYKIIKEINNKFERME